jgi:hypothetical protein
MYLSVLELLGKYCFYRKVECVSLNHRSSILIKMPHNWCSTGGKSNRNLKKAVSCASPKTKCFALYRNRSEICGTIDALLGMNLA